MISAPNAFNKVRRSMDMLSGMQSTTLYPFMAPIAAKPIPVFPLVASTNTLLALRVRITN